MKSQIKFLSLLSLSATTILSSMSASASQPGVLLTCSNLTVSQEEQLGFKQMYGGLPYSLEIRGPDASGNSFLTVMFAAAPHRIGDEVLHFAAPKTVPVGKFTYDQRSGTITANDPEGQNNFIVKWDPSIRAFKGWVNIDEVFSFNTGKCVFPAAPAL